MQEQGLEGLLTDPTDNLCLYRALYALLPNGIPNIDRDLEGAKKFLFDVVNGFYQKQLALDPAAAQAFEDVTEEVLKSLQWENGACKGLQAGNLLQAIADYFSKSFNLYTVNLIENALSCEKFTVLNSGGSPSEWLNIVCLPGEGQLRGGNTYDLHYIPAF